MVQSMTIASSLEFQVKPCWWRDLPLWTVGVELLINQSSLESIRVNQSLISEECSAFFSEVVHSTIPHAHTGLPAPNTPSPLSNQLTPLTLLKQLWSKEAIVPIRHSLNSHKSQKSRSDFQNVSGVSVKKCYLPVLMHIYGLHCDFIHRNWQKHSNIADFTM